MRARWFVVVATALALLAPPTVLAHGKWFVDANQYPIQLERLWSLPVLLALLAGAAAVGALYVLRRIVGGDNLFPRIGFLRRFDPAAPVVIAIQTAIALIYMAVNMHLLAPNLNVSGVLGYTLAAIQIFVAFTFISGALTRVGAATLIGLVVVCGLVFGLETLFEQTLYAGIALYMLLQGRGLTEPNTDSRRQWPWARYTSYAPSILRVFSGFSIAALAFTEKLLNPALSVAFLQNSPNFNVARLLASTWFSDAGFITSALRWFTDERFVYAAAIVEFVVGVALMSGILPRLVIMGMFVPFNLTIPFLPPSELLGHLPIFAIMYVLVFHLPGDRLDAEPAIDNRTRRGETRQQPVPVAGS
jgi:hypothetical protein